MRAIVAVALAIGIAGLAAGQAAADWRHDLKGLRIGFVAADAPAAAVARLEPFRAYLADKLGVGVDLLPFTGYDSLIDAEIDNRINYAINSATSFATAEARCGCVEPLAVPTAFDGARGFYSVLLARADSPIRSLDDAKGARIALSAPDSVAGRLIPMQAFAAAGIDPASYFSAVLTEAGPRAAVGALLAGDADLAVAWSSLRGEPTEGYSFGLLTRMVAEGSLSMSQVRVVWQSKLIPFGPHTLSSKAPEAVKPILMDILSGLAGDAPDIMDAVDPTSFGGGGFVPAKAEDYAAIASLVAPPAAN